MIHTASGHQLETCTLLSFVPLTPILRYRRHTPKGALHCMNLLTKGNNSYFNTYYSFSHSKPRKHYIINIGRILNL